MIAKICSKLGLLAIAVCSSVAAETDRSTNLYWGDTHVHTYLSADAYGLGTRITPDTAYRYARGEIITADNGTEVQIRKPLDFLMVADHAENLGVRAALAAGQELRLTEAGERMKVALSKNNLSIRDLVAAKTKEDQNRVLSMIGNSKGDWKSPLAQDEEFTRSVWGGVIAVAEKYNDPGKFTAFIGFEWTGLYMMHRNVLFVDGAEKTSQIVPYSLIDSADPEDLWQYLADYENKTSGRVMSIPHNANLSNGAMFSLLDFTGNPQTNAYAKTRSRWERIYEATQYKGDSEAHPDLSPDDEFADFEKMGATSPSYRKAMAAGMTKGGGKAGAKGKATAKNSDKKPKGKATAKNNDKKPQGKGSNIQQYPLKGSFARPALKHGLSQQAKLGINPFKVGLIGSTDSHVGLSSADEAGYLGKQGAFRVASAMWNAAGFAGVWASENTRQAIFAAMQRREVFASTGPRMAVRLFGGWDFEADDAFKPHLVEVGYRKGVPMGGDLTQAPKRRSPSFLIHAVRDPDGANLDRVQVIKGWRDTKGKLHEKVYNVAVSDNRKVNASGEVDSVGNTVDLSDATYTNRIGDPELTTVWTDPDFDAREHAFYYVRVLQIPTPRWIAFDVANKGAELNPEIPLTTQERLYTSPIWYTPQ
jgi:hypothetical protein